MDFSTMRPHYPNPLDGLDYRWLVCSEEDPPNTGGGTGKGEDEDEPEPGGGGGHHFE